MTIDYMALFVAFVLVLLLTIGLVKGWKRYSEKSNPVLKQSVEFQSAGLRNTNELDKIVISEGDDPELALVTISAVSNDALKDPVSLNIKDKSINTIGALCQAVPSLMVSGAASGKNLMEVVVNGNLVRASDGSGWRGFVMNGKGITEHAHLHEVETLQNAIKVAAIWQVVSVIVAQKHLADISKKLVAIKAGLDEIQHFLEEKRFSRIEQTYKSILVIKESIEQGEIPSAASNEYDRRDDGLSEIFSHLCAEYRRVAETPAEHSDSFGTEELTANSKGKINKLKNISQQIEFCLKVRIALWYAWSLCPGDQKIKSVKISAILGEIERYSNLIDYLEKGVKADVERIKSFWNTGKTETDRKNQIRASRNSAAVLLKDSAKGCEQSVRQIQGSLDHDVRTTMYLRFDDKNQLIAASRSV